MHTHNIDINEINLSSKSYLDEICREGARQMLQSALEAEVHDYIEQNKTFKNKDGFREVVRNGYLPEREFMSSCGPLKIKQPRVKDSREEKSFSSMILPPYLRKSKSLEALVPFLYLKGISTNDFSAALTSILGESPKGFSQGTVQRLKQVWNEEYSEWSNSDLSSKQYVYLWADGIHFKVRLEDHRTCILVLIGTLANGKKELVSVIDGFRESKESWMFSLRDLKKRGLKTAPKLAIGDGALGFWSALREVFPETKEQRCWVHKTANILDKMPKSLQGKAKDMIHEMYMSDTKDNALKTYKTFIDTFESKYPKAVECLTKDKDELFEFYNFPAEHWQHIRTTNPIESTFATVRLRTKRTKGCGSRKATLMMVYRLAFEAQKNWRKIKGYQWISFMIEGKKFKDGILVKAA